MDESVEILIQDLKDLIFGSSPNLRPNISFCSYDLKAERRLAGWRVARVRRAGLEVRFCGLSESEIQEVKTLVRTQALEALKKAPLSQGKLQIRFVEEK